MAVLALAAPAAATDPGTPSAADIVSALKAKQATRSLGGKKRSLTVEGGAAEEEPRSIDLQIQFEYDSSRLTNDGKISLDALGEALKSPELGGASFRIVGHTDAKGGEGYNAELSRRRAETVRAYLTEWWKIDKAKFATEGKGEAELADPANPESGLNRRVQIIATGG